MATGAVKTILVCEPSATPSAPCPAGQAPAATTAYVIEASSASYIDSATEPFDYGVASAFWVASFSVVCLIYFTSRFIEEIIDLVKRGF